MSQPEDPSPALPEAKAPASEAPSSEAPASEAPATGPIGKLRLRERRADFAMLYREMHYCYGRLLGLEGIALWNWYRLHQHGGGQYEELTGYGWTGQPSILGAHGIKHHVTLAKVRDRLIAADLLVMVRADEVFTDDELAALRAQARQRGDRLTLQRGSYLSFVHDPLTREDFVAWSGGAQCPTCPIRRSCAAYRGWQAAGGAAYRGLPAAGGTSVSKNDIPGSMSKSDTPEKGMSKNDTPSPQSGSENDTLAGQGGSKNDAPGMSKNDTNTDRTNHIDNNGDVLVQVLIKRGLSPGAARKLVRAYPAERIRDKISWIDALLRDDPGAIQNPPGYLRRAIEEDYAPRPERAERVEGGAASAAAADRRAQHAEAREPEEARPLDFRERMAQRYGVSPELRRLWERTQEELALQMPVATYNSYIGLHTVLIALEGGAATVATDNRYTQEWLSHRLRGVIEETLERVTGRVVEIAFVVGEG